MNKLNVKKISNCLRKHRKARGLKQRDVARILGHKSTSMISRWEKGLCCPTLLNALKLATLYQTLLDALFIDLVRKLRKEIRRNEARVMNHQ